MCPSTGVARVSALRAGLRQEETCQIGCVDHSAVATPDKGSKPKKERV